MGDPCIGIVGGQASDEFISNVKVFRSGSFEPIVPVGLFNFINSVAEFIHGFFVLCMGGSFWDSMKLVRKVTQPVFDLL